MKQIYLFDQMNCNRLGNLKQLKLSLFIVIVALFLFQGNIANAQLTDFTSFSTGTVNYQGAGSTIVTAGGYTIPDPYGSLWTVVDEWGHGKSTISAPPFDQEVKDDGTGNMVWRFSNAVIGSFSDQPNSPNSPLPAGETTASLWNDRGPSHTGPFAGYPLPRASAATKYFNGGFRFKSATGVAQPGLSINISPTARQSDRRNSFVSITDNGSTGFNLVFFDTGAGGTFPPSVIIASDLSYTAWHQLDIYVEFVDGLNGDGTGNDIVTVMLNGIVIHTGTTWETYYRVFTPTRPIGAVDALAFRASGTAAPGTAGNGFYIDDVTYDNLPVPDLDGPITSNVALSDDVIKVNESLTLTANVDDSSSGGSDIASAEYSYDGGATWNPMDAVDGNFDSVSENVTATFAAPSTAGVYQVCVKGTDSEGNTGDESCIELVVFNPNGGSVKHGKGRIESPPGALVSDPAAIGRADFDFKAEYKKKDDELKGKAKFKFKDGDIDFKEDNLHWLVINEDEDYAILRGDGEIKHRPGVFQFMIWGGEYDSGDTFRIRIWEQVGANEILIYDNMNDQVIDKGKIEIKPPKQARPLEENNIEKMEALNEITIWPNPSKNQFNIKLNNKDFINATIEIHDFYGKRYDKPIKITKDGILTFGENLPKGFYIIKVIIDNEVNYLRIIKK